MLLVPAELRSEVKQKTDSSRVVPIVYISLWLHTCTPSWTWLWRGICFSGTDSSALFCQKMVSSDVLLLTRPVCFFSYVCLFLSLLPLFLTFTTLLGSLHSYWSYLTICPVSVFTWMDKNYFPVFLLTPCCCQLPMQLSGLCYCSFSSVSSCLRQASAGLPLYQLHVGWVSDHPLLIQIVPDLTLLFHPFFFLLSFCLEPLTLSPSFLATLLPSFTLLFLLTP